jgi:hypothetical protein
VTLIDKINALCSGIPPSVLADRIVVQDAAGVASREAMGSFPAATINMKIINAYGNVMFLDTYLRSRSDIVDILYARRLSQFNSIVYGMNWATLFDIIKNYVGTCAFVNELMTHNSLTEITTILAANLNVSTFLADIRTYLGYSDYEYVMVSKYGAVGDYRQSLYLAEWDMYGAKRLGTLNPNMKLYDRSQDGTVNGTTGAFTASHTYATQSYDAPTPGTTGGFTRILGYKQYEITSHQGNVMVTVTDRKLQVSSTGTSLEVQCR